MADVMTTSELAPDAGAHCEARILDGRALAQSVRAEVAADIAAQLAQGAAEPPGLAVVLVGDDPASQIYVRSKTRAAQEVGIAIFDYYLPASTSADELIALITRLNQDSRVHGVLVQLPLPRGLPADRILATLDPKKDVDGLLQDNVGHLWLGQPRFVPCTPLGIMRLLQAAKTPLSGAEAVIIGRSNLVGKPIAALLLQADATVTLCHSRTINLAAHVQRADIVVAALGRPAAILGEWIKVGATVIDVGINRLADGKLVGDVEFAVARTRARAITPVPGGVGPLTIAMLLSNTARAARLQNSANL